MERTQNEEDYIEEEDIEEEDIEEMRRKDECCTCWNGCFKCLGMSWRDFM